MKTPSKTLASVLAGLVLTAEPSLAAVPTEWTVRVGPRSATYQAERYHGDALALRAALSYNGLPLDYAGEARLYAQTNGMGATWWDLAPCTVTSNVLQATWLPSFDTGADVVDVFMGAPSNFQAHARIRFLPSPGPAPNSLPMPTPVLDFSAVELRNISALTNGWSFGSSADLTPATNYTDRALGAFAETGTVERAMSYGTPTRWTDATGVVWRVDDGMGGWLATTNVISDVVVVVDESFPEVVFKYGTYPAWAYLEPGVDYSLLSDFTIPSGWYYWLDDDFTERGTGGFPVTFVREIVPNATTNLVGRVALTNDIPQSVAVVAPTTNAVSGQAADAKATGTALYTGFTEWEYDGNVVEGAKYHVNVFDEFEPAPYYAELYMNGELYGDTWVSNRMPLSITFSVSGITATRHLVTPTKTSQLTNDGSNGVPFAVETQLGTKQDALPYPTNAIPFAAISGAPTSPSVFYDAAGGAATVSGATLTYQAASNSVGSIALLAGTNVLHITAPSAITGHVRDFGLTVSTEDAATVTLDSSVSWRFDAASTNLAAGSWNRVYCTESPSGVFSLQLWTPDSAQEAAP